MDKQNSIKTDLDDNKLSTIGILSMLSDNIKTQKYFISLLNETINKSLQNQSSEITLKLEKMNCILPNVIKELGLPICDIINSNNEVINFYINNILNKNNYYDISKVIIINYINIFNFKSTDINPTDKILDLLENTDIDIKGIIDKRRTSKTKLESIYDELIELFNTWKTIRDMEDGIEEDGVEQLQALLDEKIEKIKEIEITKLYPKATIEFLKSKVNQIEEFMNEQKKINVQKLNIMNHNSNSFDNQSNGELHLNQDQRGLNENELKELREKELSKRTFFFKNEKLAYGEDQTTEFKNYLYPLIAGQEKELKRQYVGFLNSTGGRIYIGINDGKVVKGVILSDKNCDFFRNRLVGFTGDFYPNCRLDKIKVYFIPIVNIFTKQFINNLYVVKIIIFPGDPYCLYSITKKGGFISAIRKQSQVFNLDAEEINKEIIERNELKKNLKNQIQIPRMSIGFDDPEPAKNLNISESLDIKNEDLNKNNKSSKKMNPNYIYTVTIRNFDTNLKVKEINKCFAGYQQSYQKFYSKEGKFLGFGKIQFASEEAAKKFMEKFNGETLGGNKNIIMTLIKKKNFNKIINK